MLITSECIFKYMAVIENYMRDEKNSPSAAKGDGQFQPIISLQKRTT